MLGVPLFTGEIGWVGVVLTPTITPTKHPPLCDSDIRNLFLQRKRRILKIRRLFIVKVDVLSYVLIICYLSP